MSNPTEPCPVSTTEKTAQVRAALLQVINLVADAVAKDLVDETIAQPGQDENYSKPEPTSNSRSTP